MVTTQTTAPNVAKIITHSGPAHSDDFLAVCMLLLKFPRAVVERVPELPETAQVDDDTIVVDVGRRYDGLRYFDHHQDKELPSSFFLVLRDIYGLKLEDLPPDFKYVDIADRLGARQASHMFPVRRGLAEKALHRCFSNTVKLMPGQPLHSVMVEIGENILKILDDFNYAKNLRMVETSQGFIAVSHRQLSPNTVKDAHPEKNIIGIIMPSRDGATMLVQVDDNPHFIPKATTYPKKFVHNSGFVVVVDKKIEEVDPLQVAMECVID